MPIYEYSCSSCNTLTEKIGRAEVQEIACPQCGAVAERIVSVCAAHSNHSGGSTASAPACRPSSGFT